MLRRCRRQHCLYRPHLPHIARRLVGVRHSRVLPASALLGALLLCTADWVSRVIIAPDEMLVGTIVALIGAPYFMYLFLKKPV
ncbi:iron chelate uptake ABC transporter family permease subunit [uncultured Megasphaera sp.]|uniref:iron chelate uptake ABC transporter family permease subunit n=1 Tax=uncultured Megasphaera sp. TaxID=165188 RepID=UPI00349FEC24